MSFASKSPPGSGLFVRWLPLLAFIAVVVNHLWFVNSHAVNIPYHDDIYDFLHVVSLIEAAETPQDAFEEWFRQYNDHRTNASRLLVYGAYLAEGEVNFHTLTLLANLALPLILMIFFLSVRDDPYRWIFLLISALLLLNLRSHTIVLWSQAGFAYYFVFLYGFACLFTLHKVTWLKFLLAAVLCTLATLTFAAGQIVWLLGLASLLHQSLVTRRRSISYPVVWLLLAVIMLMLWRIGFGDVAEPIPLARFPDQLMDPPAPFFQVLCRYAAWFLVILGCAFTDASTLWAGIAGFVMLAVLSFVTIRFYKDDDIRLALCGWFVVATAAAVSVGRAMLLSPQYILHERYSLMSVMLTCILALLILVRFSTFRRPAVYLVVLSAAFYWTWTYRHFEGPLQAIMTERYNEFNRGQFWTVSKSLKESNGIVREAISAGIYKPPCKPFPACETSRMRAE